jgi:HlyD family secretion protein
MTTGTGKKRMLPARWPLLAAAVVVLGGLGAWALSQSGGLGGATGTAATYRVRSGPLTISVVEAGAIKSLEQASLKSEVEGQNTLIYLISEGTLVKKGELLAELDASRLQDALIQQQIAVDTAEAAFIRARENLAVARNQAESSISKAELDYQFAQEDVIQYTQGLLPQERMEATTNITLAEEELNRATEKLAWSERLFQEKYISETEYEADRLACSRAELSHKLAIASLQLLNDYTSKRKLAELESNVEQMRMALDRAKLQANADIVQAEADLKAKESDLRQQQGQLTKTEQQLAKTKIFADRDGMVVYATSSRSGSRMSEPLQEGQAIRERQELIYLPSADSMMAEIQIHESSLDKVQIGQTVRVSVDALPGQRFTGRVARIAPLPDAQSAWLNPDLKVYPTQIHLEGNHPELRTGMNCQAEIIIAQYPDALYVPIQAVVRVGAAPTVYVREGRSFQPRPIEIGLDNNSMVHVLAGLEAGDEVLLTPPLAEKAQAEHAEEAEGGQATPVEAAPGGAGPTGPGFAPPAGGAPGGGATPGGTAGPGGAPGGDGGFGAMTPEQREEARRRFESMTPEEREALRRRMENMTPEERESMQRRRGDGPGRPGGAPDRAPGGGPRGPADGGGGA